MIVKEINPKKDLIFSIKVCEACKSCKRYGLTGCCPPNIGTFEYYKKLLKQYTHGMIFIREYTINKLENYKEIGKRSSLELHKVLIKERQQLLNKGHHFNVILGGGSCKWCRECKIPCQLPHLRAIPIEATGVNVIETLKNLGITIEFPVKTKFYRVGMVLFDD